MLRRIGNTILGSLWKADFPARYGDEEIAIILPETTSTQATQKADTLREDLAHCFQEAGPPITVSIEVSSIVASDLLASANDLVYIADIALYKAKCGGKNKVVSACC